MSPSRPALSRRTRSTPPQSPVPDRPDVFLSYSRADKEFAELRLAKALTEHGKDVWIDVEDIRGGASDWRASVWAGIESAKVFVVVLTPDSLASEVCAEELQHADELNKRTIPVLRRSVKGLPVPPPLAKPNWILARPEDDFDASVKALIDAIELDEPWVEQHARLTQRTAEWLRHDRDGSYLLRGTDLRAAEAWLDDQAGHREAPTTDQVTYITASRRAAARRQRVLLAGVGVALAITAVLAIVAVVQRGRAIDREKTARAQARAAQSIAALSRDPEEAVRDALAAVAIRPKLPEARYALRRAVSSAGWTSILRLPNARDIGLLDVEFSADGTRVATASSDGRVAVWDTKSGRLVAVANTKRAVHTVQFSPDGRLLLTASDGGLAQTWNTSSGKPVRSFDTGSSLVWAATWGADGRRILTAGPDGGDLWSAAGGTRLRHLPTAESEYPGAIRMSLDGRHALTAAKGGAAWLWDLTTGQKTTLPAMNKRDPLAFSLFSRDGRRFATFYESGAYCVWQEGQSAARRCVRGAPSTDEDLSSDGGRVLQADEDGVVTVWDVEAAEPKAIARLHNGGTVSSAQFSRNGDYVVTGGDDGFARIWQVKPVRLVSLLQGHTQGVRRARFSPDGTQVATVSDDGSGRLWPARPKTPLDPDWQSADSTSFSPNSRDVLLVRGARRAIWNTRTGTTVELREGGSVPDSPAFWPCGHAAGCAPWNRDGSLVAGGSTDGGAVIWNARTGAARHFGDKLAVVIEAAFSPDGRRLVVVDGNRPRAQIWRLSPDPVKDDEPVPPRGASHADLRSAQFLEEPPRVLTVDVDNNVRLTDAEGGESTALAGTAYPAAVAALKDGSVAVGTLDGKLRLSSPAGSARPVQQATNEAVRSLEFSPTGAAIGVGGQTGTTSIWNARTLKATRLRAFGGEITGVTFSPVGDFVLVTSGDTARLWAWRLRRVLVELPRAGHVRAEFSPNGRQIVIAGTSRLEVLECVPCLPLKELEHRAHLLLPQTGN